LLVGHAGIGEHAARQPVQLAARLGVLVVGVLRGRRGGAPGDRRPAAPQHRQGLGRPAPRRPRDAQLATGPGGATDRRPVPRAAARPLRRHPPPHGPRPRPPAGTGSRRAFPQGRSSLRF